MKEVITCKEFNRRGFEQHRKAVEEWQNEVKPTTYPSVLFYIFHKDKERATKLWICISNRAWWRMV